VRTVNDVNGFYEYMCRFVPYVRIAANLHKKDSVILSPFAIDYTFRKNPKYMIFSTMKVIYGK